MRYHDYHLREYLVADFGTRIIFSLTLEAPGQPTDESTIEFLDVALYHFTHTAGAIITDISAVPLRAFLTEQQALLSSWSKQQALRFWDSSFEEYFHTLEKKRYRAWIIGSAIGFEGFIIARESKGLRL
ncbi:MAG: hypothetical protein ACK4UN_13015 [Limisphaerales bacterium]